MRKTVLLLLFLVFGKCNFAQTDFNISKGFGVEIAGFGEHLNHYYSISANCTYKINKQLLFLGVHVNDAFENKEGDYGPYIGFRIYPHKNQRKIKMFYQSYYWFCQRMNTDKWLIHYFFLGAGFSYNVWKDLNLGVSMSAGIGYAAKHAKYRGLSQLEFQPEFKLSYSFAK